MPTTTTTILQRYSPPQQLEVGVLYYDAGGTTLHTHRCPQIDGGHIWKCNSPYCQSLTDLCPDHGGELPVKIGREPWKR